MDIRHDTRMCLTETTGHLPARAVEGREGIYDDRLHGWFIHAVVVPLFREDESEMRPVDFEASEL